MKEIPIPAEEGKRGTLLEKLKKKRKALNVTTLVFGLLAVLALFAVLGVLVFAELNGKGWDVLLLGLAVGFGGGALLFSGAALLFASAATTATDEELDYRERLHGKECFFVGEGTLARFEEKELYLFQENGKGAKVRVPYAEMRFFSVCARRNPRDKGEWKIVLEMPLRYLAKAGKAEPGDPPALIETEYKTRLLDCLSSRGLTLDGTKRGEEPVEEAGRAVAVYKFPDSVARRRAFWLTLVAGVITAGSVPVALFFNSAVGIMLGCFAVFFLIRSLIALVRAKSVLTLYEAGVHWKEKTRDDSVYLWWREVESVVITKTEKFSSLDVQCYCGLYHFPAVTGVEEVLAKSIGDKFKGEEA